MKKKQRWAVGVLALTITVGGGVLLNQQAYAGAAIQTGTQAEASAAAAADAGKTGRGGFHKGSWFAGSEEIAGLLGMTTDELKEALKSGSTLAELAADKGVDVQKLTDAIAAKLTARLDEKLSAGSITQEEYDSRKAEITEKAGQIVSGEINMKSGRKMGGFFGASEEVAGLLGLTQDELKEAVKSGKTLADLAAEKNVDTQKLADLIISELTAKLDEQLAAGRLTQEQYDERKAELAEQAAAIISGELKPHGGHGGKGKHGGRGSVKSGTVSSVASAAAGQEA
ncbi:hypothetical protein DNH61_02030 [Paenibacillus sambharensis]|uniref:SHOCT domain-containing protein n=1 Tax=Paenibacillus sambharensis TaxID=1803190 RepID=A0A2W1LI32_9BACL|nr:SHOCT domain-containing protein [Paenibacillus sambharensis]PZD97670.1 hypothetical protein DNH61_02030 [Paenibacillus sambharensis]